MSWFVFAVISVLGWGLADLFYKKGTEENDRLSYLKIAVWVGLVMGVCSVLLLIIGGENISPKDFLINVVKYSPASLGYILSMIIGYAGLRYLELSIVSPVQNASGAFSAVAIMLFFILTGNNEGIQEALNFNAVNVLNVVGTLAIIVGVILLAVVEQKLSKSEVLKEDKKYQKGALALIFPILYCLFDTIGTSADGIILNESTGLGLTEMQVLVIYGLTFFVAGVVCWLIILIKQKKPYNPFTAKEIKTKGVAAFAEEFGQVFYVYAMAKNPIMSAPMIASYCIVSVLFSKIFLKEKLQKSQYACVIAVIFGIVLLGIAEGISVI